MKGILLKTGADSSLAPDLLGSRKAHIFLILTLGFIAYANSFHCSFHPDDSVTITDNPIVRDYRNLKAIWNFSSVRFIGVLSFAINYHFNRLDVFGYHVVNFLIHIGASLAVWQLVLLLFATPVMQRQKAASHGNIAALACGLLFVSHPIQTEAVTYIVQRYTSLAALFYLISLCLYLKAQLTHTRWKQYLFFSGAVVTALPGMVTKEIVFTLPFAIILFEFAFFNDRTRINADSADKRGLKDKIRVYPFYSRKSSFHDRDDEKYRYFILLILILCAFSLIIPALRSFDMRDIPGTRISARFSDPPLTGSVYLMTQFRVIVTYLRLLVLPIHQNIDYDFPVSTSFFEMHTFSSVVAIASLFCFALFIYQKNRITGVGILWFFLTLAVESSIVPSGNVISEHRLYLPMAGYSIAAAGFFLSPVWKNRTRLAAALFLCIVCFNTALTVRRNMVWKDDQSLWSDSVKKSPHKDRPCINLANYYREQGNFDEARKLYERVLQLNPENVQACNNLGDISFREGKTEEAKYHVMRALSINPDNPSAHNYLGNICSGEGETEEARRQYSRAIELAPEFADAYKNLGALYYREKMPEKAYEQYSRALTINPYDSEAHTILGVICSDLGNYENAVKQWQEAIRLSPEHAEAFNDYAWFLATTTDERYRDPIHAVIYAETACDITGFQNPKYLDTLAAAYADNGRFIEARETAEKALTKLKTSNDRLALDIARRLENYKRRLPHREGK